MGLDKQGDQNAINHILERCALPFPIFFFLLQNFEFKIAKVLNFRLFHKLNEHTRFYPTQNAFYIPHFK